jgi:MFS family permease
MNYSIIQILYALEFLRYGIVFPMVPLYAERLGAGPLMIGVIVGMFSFFALFLALPMGRLVDRLGVKRILIYGVCCKILSAIMLMGAESLLDLILAQIGSGFAFLLHVVGCQAYISNLDARTHVERGFGQLSLWAAIGQTMGPVVGGLMVAHAGYPLAFGACLIISLLGLAVLKFAEDPLDIADRSRQSAATNSDRVLSLISEPKIRFVLLFSFSVIFAINLRSSFLPVFLRSQSLSEDQIGIIIGLLSAMAILIRLFFGWLCAKFSRKDLLLLSSGLVGLGTLVIPLLPSISGVSFAVMLLGLGFGVTQPLTMLMVSDLRPAGTAGLVMGLRFTLIMLATLVSPVALGFLVRSYGIEYAFYVSSAGVFLNGLLILLKMK